MSRFLTPLDVDLVNDPLNLWRLRAPLRYPSDAAGCGINVPVGFLTDFASVPRLSVVF